MEWSVVESIKLMEKEVGTSEGMSSEVKWGEENRRGMIPFYNTNMNFNTNITICFNIITNTFNKFLKYFFYNIRNYLLRTVCMYVSYRCPAASTLTYSL